MSNSLFWDILSLLGYIAGTLIVITLAVMAVRSFMNYIKERGSKKAKKKKKESADCDKPSKGVWQFIGDLIGLPKDGKKRKTEWILFWVSTGLLAFVIIATLVYEPFKWGRVQADEVVTPIITNTGVILIAIALSLVVFLWNYSKGNFSFAEWYIISSRWIGVAFIGLVAISLLWQFCITTLLPANWWVATTNITVTTPTTEWSLHDYFAFTIAWLKDNKCMIWLIAGCALTPFIFSENKEASKK